MKSWRVFAEISKICCETANKALNIINNRAIQFVKEGNISKTAKAKKVFVIELTVPYEENFDWAHQRKLEKYEDLRE